MDKIGSKEFYEDLKNKGLGYCSNCKRIKDEKMFEVGFCMECSKVVGKNQYILTKEKLSISVQ